MGITRWLSENPIGTPPVTRAVLLIPTMVCKAGGGGAMPVSTGCRHPFCPSFLGLPPAPLSQPPNWRTYHIEDVIHERDGYPFFCTNHPEKGNAHYLK